MTRRKPHSSGDLDLSGLLDRAEEMLRLALRGGADEAEAFCHRDYTRKVHYRDREVELVDISENLGFSLRLTRAGRQGFAYLSAATPRALGDAVAEALASARWGDEPAVPFAGPAPAQPAVREVDDPAFFIRGDGPAREFLRQRIEEAFAVSPRVRRVKRAAYAESRHRSGLVTSAGFRGEKGGTHYTLGASVLAEADGLQEVAHEWAFGRHFEDLAVQSPVAEAARLAAGLLGGVPVATGRYPVILAPAVAVELLGVFAQALSGEMVAKGKSPLAGRLGQEVGSPLFSLVDDGLRPGGYGSEPFDDEGVPRRCLPLVEKGVLRNFLLNRKAAALLSREPTGNGTRADYKALPGIRPGNLYLDAAGRGMPVDRMGEGIARGLLVQDIMGSHTLDPISGNVSLGAAGLLIEDGVPGRPFRGVTISGNLYQLFGRLTAAGDDLRFHGDLGSPSLLLEFLDVAGE